MLEMILSMKKMEMEMEMERDDKKKISMKVSLPRNMLREKTGTMKRSAWAEPPQLRPRSQLPLNLGGSFEQKVKVLEIWLLIQKKKKKNRAAKMEGGGGEEGVEMALDSKDLQQQSNKLDKLTDRVEDRQLNSTRVPEAMASIAASGEADWNAIRMREKELAAVKINAADIDIIANELEICCLSLNSVSYNPLERREACKGGKEASKKCAPSILLQITELKLSVDSLEKERDFYFAKEH